MHAFFCKQHFFSTQPRCSEADAGSVLSKKVLLGILQNSQENTCARVFF